MLGLPCQECPTCARDTAMLTDHQALVVIDGFAALARPAREALVNSIAVLVHGNVCTVQGLTQAEQPPRQLMRWLPWHAAADTRASKRSKRGEGDSQLLQVSSCKQEGNAVNLLLWATCPGQSSLSGLPRSGTCQLRPA